MIELCRCDDSIGDRGTGEKILPARFRRSYPRNRKRWSRPRWRRFVTGGVTQRASRTGFSRYGHSLKLSHVSQPVGDMHLNDQSIFKKRGRASVRLGGIVRRVTS
jgi:hypothetical protein